jgi:hypothetical protein
MMAISTEVAMAHQICSPRDDQRDVRLVTWKAMAMMSAGTTFQFTLPGTAAAPSMTKRGTQKTMDKRNVTDTVYLRLLNQAGNHRF